MSSTLQDKVVCTQVHLLSKILPREAVNELIRRGMLVSQRPEPFVPRARRLGLRIDVSNVADALDLLEGPDAR